MPQVARQRDASEESAPAERGSDRVGSKAPPRKRVRKPRAPEAASPAGWRRASLDRSPSAPSRPERSRPRRPGSSSPCPPRAKAPRCRPCPSRSRTAARRARPRRPSRFSHFKIVPSTIVSPSCGIWIDVTSSLLTSAASRSTAASMSATCGRNASSSGGENGTGTFGGASRIDRRVEVFEGLLGDHRRDLRADPEEPVGLVEDERPRRLLDRAQDRLLVQRDRRCGGRRPRPRCPAGEGLRGLERLVHHRAVRDDRHVRTLALHVGRPDRDRGTRDPRTPVP